MATSLTDTDPEAERVQLELLRRAARSGLAAKMPGASDLEVALRFVALHYRPGLADELRGHLLARR